MNQSEAFTEAVRILGRGAYVDSRLAPATYIVGVTRLGGDRDEYQAGSWEDAIAMAERPE